MTHHFIQTNNLGYSLTTGRVLFKNINISIQATEKVGLVGDNGTGKSSLIKLLVGQIKPNQGSINTNAKIGYAPQLNKKSLSKQSLSEFLQKQIGDWWEPMLKVEQIFGNKITDANQTMNSLSGGELTKINIALALCLQPDILLLDEPTNHLDIVAKLKLQEFLKHFSGAVVLVSHDTHFMDQVVSKIWELDNENIISYGGNYSFYKQQKQLSQDRSEKEFKEAKNNLYKAKHALLQEEQKTTKSKKLGEKRVREGSMTNLQAGFFKDKATQKIGKKKAISVQKIEAARQDVLKKEPTKRQQISINLSGTDTRNGKQLFNLQQASLTVSKKKLLSQIDFHLTYGDRVALLGANGSGKSSFLKALIGQTKKNKLQGKEVFRCPQAKHLYLDQKYSNVDLKLSLLENMNKIDSQLTQHEIRQVLGSFLFKTKHNINRSAKTLSGGELARLSFAMANISSADILVLDEPTNNLDVNTIEIITKALQNFRGAILIVSHNIDFLKNINISKAWFVKNNQLIQMQHNPSEQNDFQSELLYLNK